MPPWGSTLERWPSKQRGAALSSREGRAAYRNERAAHRGPASTDGAISSYAIETRGLTKVFGSQRAVDAIDMRVPTGSVYGFLGPNGSGKTTTIRMLLGLVRPTEGDHDVLGHHMPEGLTTALHRVGSLIEGPAFHAHRSGLANLRRLDAADARSDAATSEAR